MSRNIRWHSEKARSNITKHGISFEQALDALEDMLVLTVRDDRHPVEEFRYVSIGETRMGRLLTIGHTDDEDELRIITARDATRSERRAYEG